MMNGDEAAPAMPWQAVMAYGMGHLRLPPDQFWALGYREFRTLLPAGYRLVAPMTRGAFNALADRYPDGDAHDPK